MSRTSGVVAAGAGNLPDPNTIGHGGTGSTTAAGAIGALGGVAKAGDTMTGQLTLPGGGTGAEAITVDEAAALGAATRTFDLLNKGFVGDGSDEGAAFNTLLAAATPGDEFILPARLGTTVPLVIGIDGVTVRGRGPGTGRADDGVGGAGTRIEVMSGFTGGPTPTTVAGGSDGADVSTWTTAAPGTLAVASTTGFDTTGRLYVATAAGLAYLEYLGVDATHFLAVTYFYGPGAGSVVSTGGAVNGEVYALTVKRPTKDRPLAAVHLRDFLVDGATAGGNFSCNDTSRVVTDGVTNTSTTLTSATAAFVSGDVGGIIQGNGIPWGTTIASRTNGTTVVLSQAATATAGSLSIRIFKASRTGTRVTRTGGLPISGLLIESYRARTDNIYVHKMSGRGVCWRGNSGPTESGPDASSWHTYDSKMDNADIAFCGEEGLTLHVGGVDVQGSGGNIYQNLINFHAFDEAACQWALAQFYSSIRDNILFDNGGSRSQFVEMKIEESGRRAFALDSNRRGPVDIRFTGGRFKTAACNGRQVADVVTNTTTTITSATAVFTQNDVGAPLLASQDIAAGTTIASVTDANTAVLSAAATGSHSGVTVTIGAWSYATLGGANGTTHNHFKGCDWVYDSGGGPLYARAFINCAAGAQKTDVGACWFGDGLVSGNTHLNPLGAGTPLVDANSAGVNATYSAANKGIPDTARNRRRRAIADANATGFLADDIIAWTSLSASRTYTPPAAASAGAGFTQTIKDESGSASGSVKITFVGTLDGAVNPDLVVTARGKVTIYSDGTNWQTA